MRKYGWRQDKLDVRDKLYRKISKPRMEPLPEVIDLRSGCSPVEDQLSLGACTAHALVGALEYLELKAGQPLTNLSRLFLYYQERAFEGDVNEDGGAQLRDGVKVLNQSGVCSESDWPYETVWFKNKPTQNAYTDALNHRITSYHRLLSHYDRLDCLASGFPFVFGFTVFSSFESEEVAKTGIVPMPVHGEEELGGHAVLAVGYDQITKQFLVRNSWGPGWGLSGYFEMPFEYLEMYSDDFWVVMK